MSMQTPYSITPAIAAQGLLWVLSPAGWALGWLSEPQPLLEQTWPQGEPPDDCPAPDLGWALRQATGAQGLGSAPFPLHLLVSEWATPGRVSWWPDAGRRLKPWRELADDTRLHIASVRVLADEQGPLSLWEWAHQAWPLARPLRGIQGWSRRVAQHPGRVLAVSILVCMLLHGGAGWVLRPALIQYRQQLQEQAAQAQRLEWAQQEQVRAQAQEAENQTQRQVWQNRQHDALLPLVQLLQWIDHADRAQALMQWTELRWSPHAWTIAGLATHETAGQAMRGAPWADGQIEWLESSPTVWPPAPQWGAPAWRFQMRLHAPRSDPTGRPQEVP